MFAYEKGQSPIYLLIIWEKDYKSFIPNSMTSEDNLYIFYVTVITKLKLFDFFFVDMGKVNKYPIKIWDIKSIGKMQEDLNH